MFLSSYELVLYHQVRVSEVYNLAMVCKKHNEQKAQY